LLCRDGTLTLGAIQALRTRLVAATGVTRPVTRHASVMASAMATLAEMSDNRPVMRIGTGFSSLRTIGLPRAEVADVKTFIATVRTLLRGEPVQFGDTEGWLSWLETPPAVPVVIAAIGPRMTRTATHIADGVILHQGPSPDMIGRALGWVAKGQARRSVGAPEISCWGPYSLADDPAEERDRVRARVGGALMNARLDWFPATEREAVERLQATYDVGHHASAAPDHAAPVPDSLADRYAIAESPERVRAQLSQLRHTPGIDSVILTPQVIDPGARGMGEVLRDLERTVLREMPWWSRGESNP
jgi:alkanesulfonate monooxygenase SsuD/methylene tetrahydromethanopterin reductase-like flavin-dependent oxidoreductase (luciferase family)